MGAPADAAQRSQIGDIAPALIATVDQPMISVGVPPERALGEVPLQKLALATPGPGDVLRDAQSPVAAAVPATVTLRAREKVDKPSAIAAPANADPLMLVVSLGQQKLDVYRGTELVTSTKVSSGKPGHDTRTGVFSILEKRRRHHSNLFSGAPMPWMQRMTWTGTALHGGVVPGYPASHGCVRLPFSFAPKLFQMTNVGENVVVAHNRIVPEPIEHPNLFQPASAQALVSLALADRAAGASDAGAVASLQSSRQAVTDSYAIAGTIPGTPLRILITRRTERDRIIAVQYLLSSLGYLKLQNFTGRVGAETIAAIKAFQKTNGLTETGAVSADLAKAVYRVAGRVEPPEGHLYVRQDFNRLFDVPVVLRDPGQKLGTHVFAAMTPPAHSGKMPWVGVSLEGDDSASVLDRIEIPDEVRQEISAQLTPGSSLIVAETSVASSLLREGDDFIVWTNDTPMANATPGTRQSASSQAKIKKAKSNQTRVMLVGKPRVQTPDRSVKSRSNPPGSYGGFWLFGRR